MDDVSWGVLTLALTLLGGLYTYLAYQRRGLAAGLRGAAITLLPVAAYLTDTLQMFTRIADAIGDWATSLVFSPAVWVGVVVAGMSVVLLGAARVVAARSGPARVEAPAATKRGRAPAVSEKAPPAAEPADDDMAEIEALLRKRGIS